MFKLRRSDMEPRESRFIVETLNVLKDRASDKELKWDAYCMDIKTVLDSRFGSEWNVMIGKSMGYAMKSRKKSSLVASSANGEIVVCWKSPGFEIEDSDMVKTKAQIIVDERDTLLDNEGSKKNPKLTIVDQPAVDSMGYTTDSPQVIRVLNALASMISEKDHQEAARIIRTNLTARFGTIWHVTVGTTQEFHMQLSRGATDHVIAVLKKGGMKIEVFRHKQSSPTGLKAVGLSVPSTRTIIDVLPKILFFIMCLAFIVQRSALCDSSDGTFAMSKLTYGVCWVSFSIPLTPLAGGLFLLTLFKQVKSSLDKRRAKSRKAQ